MDGYKHNTTGKSKVMQGEVVFNVFMITQKPIMNTPVQYHETSTQSINNRFKHSEWLYLAWRDI